VTTVVVQGGGVCDFCSSEPVVMTIVVNPFELPVPEGMANPPIIISNDNWFACEGCAWYVERSDWTGLRDSILSRFGPTLNKLSFNAHAVITELYQRLAEHTLTFKRGVINRTEKAVPH
jgi:hypothetical protein